MPRMRAILADDERLMRDQIELGPGLLQPGPELVAHQSFVIGQNRAHSGHGGSRW